MKKQLLSLTILFFISLCSFSQCPPTAITLSSQADVDAFTTNYPGCTDLQSTLTISGNDITDLTPLISITSVETLNIMENSSLANLEGLNNITLFDFSLYIYNNNILTDISALSNLQATNCPSCTITNNPLLNSLNGLQGITNTVCYLTIENNDSLIDLTGISEHIGVAEHCRIQDNDALQSFNGIVAFWALELTIDNNIVLNDVSAFNDNTSTPFLNITNNPNLAICSNTMFCASIGELQFFIEQYPLFVIENNAEGCNSVGEVAYSCGTVPLNDECDDAFPLTIGETLVTYNELATISTQIPSCNDVNRLDVWFTVNSGSFTSLDIISEAGYSLQLWEGDCASLTQVASACAENALTDIPVTTDTDYYVQVWSDSEARRATGLFDIIVQGGTLSNQEFAFEGFTVYPNPTNNILNLKSNSAITSIQVYNLLGQQMLTSSPNALSEEIDMTDFNSGMYLVKVEIGEQTATYKIIKQ